jgi:hypothetical protein
MRAPASLAAGFAVAALWMLGPLALAQKPSDWRITADLQIVAISPQQALKLVPKLSGPETFAAAFAELQGMIEREEAELAGWPVLVGAGQEPASSKSSRGVPFATEFQPPQAPGLFGRPPTLPEDTLPWVVWGAATPTAIDTRGTGVEFAATDTSSENGEIINLSLAARCCQLEGFQITRGIKTPAGIEGLFENPEFLENKSTVRLAVHNGRRVLLGTFVTAKPAPKVWLFLLEAVATRITAPSAFP